MNIGNLGQLASTLKNSDDKQVLINHCADEIKFTSKTDRNKSTYVFFSVDELCVQLTLLLRSRIITPWPKQ